MVCAIVERATRNPAGVIQETAGPFNRSFGADAAQRLYLTRAERAVIRAAVGRLALTTLATTRGAIETAPVADDTPWWWPGGGDDPLPTRSPPGRHSACLSLRAETIGPWEC
ncbi:MAG: hypothetical protein M5U14_09420 [Acidimicrobiia bacterium]|nr:hypothetical protein [Acidimicrobiia bacterium]